MKGAIRVKLINNYFFGSEKIALSDGIWFYGGYTLSALIVLISILY